MPPEDDPIVPFQPLPINLVAALPELPFDVYVRRADRMVLYAVQGTDSRTIVERARAGVAMQAPLDDPQAMRRLLLGWLVRDLETAGVTGGGPRWSPGGDSAVGAAGVPDATAVSASAGSVADGDASAAVRRVVAVLATLLETVFSPAPALEPGSFGAARAGVDVFAQSLAIDRGLARAILTRTVEPRLEANVSVPWRWACRALDAVAAGIPLAIETGVSWEYLRPLARALAFRDLGMPRVLHGRRPGGSNADRGAHPARRHVDVSVELLSAVSSAGDQCVQLVREHHERFDGSGYPAGRPGVSRTPGSAIVALADAFVPILSPESAAPAATAEEAIRRLHLAAAGRHEPAVAWTLVRLLASGGLLPLGGGALQ